MGLKVYSRIFAQRRCLSEFAFDWNLKAEEILLKHKTPEIIDTKKVERKFNTTIQRTEFFRTRRSLANEFPLEHLQSTFKDLQAQANKQEDTPTRQKARLAVKLILSPDFDK